MAGIDVPINRPASQRIGHAAVAAPRVVMSWEDWLTLASAVVCFLAVAISIQQAHWVRDMPSVVPTSLAGLVIGMVGARIRLHGAAVHPIAILLGVGVVVLAVQGYADGATIFERVDDLQARMYEWWLVVRDNDISNDNLPFIVLVHSVVYLTAFLAAYSIYRWHTPWVAILPAGLVILSNLGFQRGHPSGAFVFFLFGAILLVSRMHLQRNLARWKTNGVEYPEFISLSAIQLTIFLTLGLLIVSWAVPLGTQADAVGGVYDVVTKPFTGQNDTFSRLFHNVDSRKGARLHTFGPLLPIKGNVKLGTKRLAEVKSGQAGLVRGTSYDTYTGVGWKSTNRDTTRVEGGELAASKDVAEYQSRNVTILQVTMLDTDTTLLTAGMPLGTNKDARVETPNGFPGDIEQIYSRRGLNPGETYNTIGSESTADAKQLTAAGAAYPDWVKQRYLQLPKGLPQRVRDEAKKAAGGATTPYEQAANIEAYLRQLPYDLNVDVAPPGRDAVDYFLFDLRRGYFDYHATAMTVMLRSMGIPARIAVGYVLDPNEVNETTYVVRKDDAYTWVEVFFPKYGWVNFNPTPDKPEGGATGSFGQSTRADTAPIVDPLGLDDLFAPDPGLVGPNAVNTALSEKPIEKYQPPWYLIWSLVAVLVVAAVTFLAGRMAWNWGLGGLEPRARLWAKAQRLAGIGGLGSRPAETPREWSRRIGAAVALPAESQRLAEAYEEARYGRPDLQRIDDSEASSAYRRLRGALVTRVFRRRSATPDAGAKGSRRRRRR